MKEILFVSHKYPPATGGMEKQSFELINGMHAYAKVHKLVYEGKESRIRFFITLSARITRLCKANPGIQHIHFNDGLLAAFCSFHYSYRHLKLSATLHGLDVVFPSALYHKYILPRFNSFSRLIAVSQDTARRAIALGIDSNRIDVIRNGVDVSESDQHEETAEDRAHLNEWLNNQGVQADDKRLLILMGRPVRRKGMSWFIAQVLPRLSKDFMVLMIGPFKKEASFFEKCLDIMPATWSEKIMLFLGFPSDEKAIRKLLNEHDRVAHLGRLPRERINQLMRCSSAFLMPNIAVQGDMEGFGLVCLEASVQGALVLAAEIDGIPDAIQHQKNGVLLKPGSAQIWTDYINQLPQEGEERSREIQSFTRFTKENYSWDRMVRAYYDLLLGKSDLGEDQV